MNAIQSLHFFIPELVLLAGAFTVIFADLFLKTKKYLPQIALVFLAGTALLVRAPETSLPLFSGLFTLDGLTHLFRLIALGVVALTVLISMGYKPLAKSLEGEYYAFFLFICFGLILIAAASNLLMIFLAIEFVSLSSYLLVGFLKKDSRAKEAALKYLLFGSFASGIMLYGMSLLFGISGSLDLAVIAESIRNFEGTLPSIALLFFLVGLGFKISMVPFHMWAPDVYEAAPTAVTGFLTVGPKALGFAVMIRVLMVLFPALAVKWSAWMIVFSILTMTVGNFMAVTQSNIKRLLAYSSIAQAGYILMGLAAYQHSGLNATVFYLIAYAFTNLGIFAAVIAVSNQTGRDDLDSYRGLAQSSPLVAALITGFLLSLAGIPPFGGFLGKFLVFLSAVEANLIPLVIIAALNSVVAAYYYFRIVKVMYLEPVKDPAPAITIPFPLKTALILLMAGTLLIGLMPSPVINWIHSLLVL